jgi:hypothetical protein
MIGDRQTLDLCKMGIPYFFNYFFNLERDVYEIGRLIPVKICEENDARKMPDEIMP